MIRNNTVRQIGITVGVLISMVGLLFVGGWAFLGGIGAVLGSRYLKTHNRGYLIAAMTFIGLGLGTGIELALGREGGVAMLIGLGLGLPGITSMLWFETRKILMWPLVASIAFFGLAAYLWSYTVEDLKVFLSIFPFVILVMLGYAGFEFWINRRTLAAASA